MKARRALQVAFLAIPALGAGIAAWSLLADGSDPPDDGPTAGPSRGLDDFGDPLPPFAVRRFGSTRLRPGTNALALSADGTRVYSGHRDGRVREWDVGTGKVLRVLDTNLDHVVPRSRNFERAFERVFEAEPKGPDTVERVLVSPDGAWLATSTDGCVRVFDVATGTQRAQALLTEGNRSGVAGFSADGKRLLVNDRRWLLWDFATGAGPAPVDALPFFSDDGSGYRSRDGRIVIHEPRWSGTRTWLLDIGTGALTPVTAPGTDAIWALPAPGAIPLIAWVRPQQKATVTVAGFDGKPRFPAVELSPEDAGGGCVWLPDASALLVGTQNGVLRIDAATGESTRLAEPGSLVFADPVCAGRAIAYRQGVWRVLDLATLAPVHPAQAGDAVAYVAWAPARPTVALVRPAGDVVVADALTGAQQAGPFRGHSVAAFDETGARIAVMRRKAVALIDLTSGAEREFLATDVTWPCAVAGDTPVWIVAPPTPAAQAPGTKRAPAAPTGPATVSLRRADDGSFLALDGVRQFAGPHAFSVGGRRVAARTESGRLAVWNTIDGHRIGEVVEASWSSEFALSPNGNHAVYFMGDVKVAAFGGDVRTVPMPGRPTWNEALAVSSGGRRIARAAPGGTIWLLDVGAPEHPARLAGHSENTNQLSFSTDGRYLASRGADATVLIWDVEAALRAAAAEPGTPPR